MKSLINYFIKYPISGNLLMVLILIFGIVGMMNMQSTFFPQTPVRNIMIQTIYPGASAEEIEESVVLKIEDQLTGVTGVERVTSTSKENSASVNVEIKKQADIDEVLQNVKNAVDQISSFPASLESVDIFKIEPKNGAISFSITGSDDLYILKKYARKIERDLLETEGISKINIAGFPDEEISIEFKESKLKAYGISMQQVLEKVKSSNIDITGGTIKGENEEFKIRLKNKSYTAEGLQNLTVLANSNGKLVRLKDVAEINDKWAEAPDRNFLNGKPAVTIDISYTNDEDLIGIVEDVKLYIADLNESQNTVQIGIISDRSDVVQQRIDMLVDNGVKGFGIVLILLAMFLHWRLALWVALSIPIAFAGMFLLASFFDVTINVISLFGMITVIGILVDDGVVISENIYRHFEMGKSRTQAAIDGTTEVMPAVFSAILTTIIVFSTFFFVEGRLGDFFGEMAFIVIATLIFSLVEGLFILPAHVAHSKALNRDNSDNALMRSLTRFMDWLKNKLYRPALEFSLKNTALSIAIPLSLFIITLGAMKGGIIRSTFFPSIERENVSISLKMPAGVQENITKHYLDQIEDGVWEVNEFYKESLSHHKDIVLTVDKRIGPGTGNLGSMTINLLPGEIREVRQADVIVKLREVIGEIPGAEEFSFGSGSPFGKQVSVALHGDNMIELREVAEKLKGQLKELTDLKDVGDNDLAGTKEVIIKLKEKAYLLGVTDQQIMLQVRQGFFGGEVQRIQRGLDEVKIWVRYNLEERATLKQLKQMEIKTTTGGKYLLSELVDFDIQRGVVSISHTDGKREIIVDADIANPKTSSIDLNNLIESDLLPGLLANYPDITYNLEGQSREQAKSTNSMKKVVPIVLLLMISVIILTFRSVSQTLVVVLLIPFGFIGVAWGHYIHDMQISLFSVLGGIALIGILINDALVFVSAFNINIKQGMNFDTALKEAALSRFRPIVLTSITTIAGLAPLIFEKSFQAQFLIPMALSIAYGLAVSTLIVLIILPILLIFSNQLKRFIHWYWYDEKLTTEQVEPAFKELKYETEDEDI